MKKEKDESMSESAEAIEVKHKKKSMSASCNERIKRMEKEYRHLSRELNRSTKMQREQEEMFKVTEKEG